MTKRKRKRILVLEYQVIAVLRKAVGNSTKVHTGQLNDLQVRKIRKRVVERRCCSIEPEVDALPSEPKLIHRVIVDDVRPEYSNTSRRSALLSIHSGQGIRICKQVGSQGIVGGQPTG